MKKMLLVPLLAVSMMISACAPLLGALMTGSATPPQAPTTIINVSRGAVDFALNSFDAALYGLDFAMDAGKIIPGSPKAKQIAKAGRDVMAALGGLEALRDAASSATYDAAWQKANEALREFRSLVGNSPSAGLIEPLPLTPKARLAVLDQLDAAA
jgi:hypothetical protein